LSSFVTALHHIQGHQIHLWCTFWK